MTSFVNEPNLSVQKFEAALAKWIAAQKCHACGISMGSAPRRMLNKKQYHPKCIEGK